MHIETTTVVGPDGLVEITAAAPKQEERVLAEAAYPQFIAEHWASLAAAAYEGFQRFGIGAVVVDMNEAPTSEHQIVATWNLGYVPSHSTWVHEHLAEETAHWLDDQFQTYDPRATALFLFADAGPGMHPYAARSPLTPRDAFGRSRAPLN